MTDYQHINLNDTNDDVRAYLAASTGYRFEKAVWNWEFIDIPYPAVFHVAKDADKFIGTQSFLPVDLYVGGQAVKSAKSESSFLNKDYRGQGIFEKLYGEGLETCRRNGIDLVWGFTSAAKVWKNTLRFDVVEQNIVDLRIFFEINDYNQSLLKSRSSNRLHYLMQLSRNRRLARKNKKAVAGLQKFGQGIETSERLRSPNDMADLYATLQKKHPGLVHLAVNEAYLQWRVYNNPNIQYHTCFYYESDALISYSIYSIDHTGTLQLADLTARDEATLQLTWNHLLIKALEQNACGIYYFGNNGNKLNEWLYACAAEFNADRSPSSWAHTVIKDLAGTYGPGLDTSNWYINGLWTQGFSI